MDQTPEPTPDKRTERILEHAMRVMERHREEFGHLPPLEYMEKVAALRPQEDAELEALIDSGHFDDPK